MGEFGHSFDNHQVEKLYGTNNKHHLMQAFKQSNIFGEPKYSFSTAGVRDGQDVSPELENKMLYDTRRKAQSVLKAKNTPTVNLDVSASPNIYTQKVFDVEATGSTRANSMMDHINNGVSRTE